jgi:hypothetical protein
VQPRINKTEKNVVSDNDTKLKKSIREMDYCHIPDIGHTLALAVENAYKKGDIQIISSAGGGTKGVEDILTVLSICFKLKLIKKTIFAKLKTLIH